jgi:AraC-like DNA-binding protein
MPGALDDLSEALDFAPRRRPAFTARAEPGTLAPMGRHEGTGRGLRLLFGGAPRNDAGAPVGHGARASGAARDEAPRARHDEAPRARHDEAPRARHDEQVHRAVDLMLGAVDVPWTVARLARQVGLSRAAFARRFVAATGSSPRRFLAGVRMRRAAELLRATDWGLARVGAAVGYDSEFAFNRAFKRAHGIAPGAYRRGGLGPRLAVRAAA